MACGNKVRRIGGTSAHSFCYLRRHAKQMRPRRPTTFAVFVSVYSCPLPQCVRAPRACIFKPRLTFSDCVMACKCAGLTQLVWRQIWSITNPSGTAPLKCKKDHLCADIDRRLVSVKIPYPLFNLEAVQIQQLFSLT